MAITTSDYLNQLKADKQALVDNLTSKGVTGLTGDETFTELVPEILNIPSGGGLDWEALGLTSFENILSKEYQNAIQLQENWNDNIRTTSQMYNYSETLVFFPKVSMNKVTNSSQMFNRAKKLLSVADIILPSAINCSQMFYYCTSLKNVGKIEVPSATNINSLFSSCNELEKIDGIITSGQLRNVSSIYGDCSSLSDFPLDMLCS